MNDSASPRLQECQHEWVFCHDFDEDTNMERPYVVCRLCGQNAGDNTGEIRIHETRLYYIQHPALDWTMNHKQAYPFQGTGLNTWYRSKR
jgi:hypothetical protein